MGFRGLLSFCLSDLNIFQFFVDLRAVPIELHLFWYAFNGVISLCLIFHVMLSWNFWHCALVKIGWNKLWSVDGLNNKHTAVALELGNCFLTWFVSIQIVFIVEFDLLRHIRTSYFLALIAYAHRGSQEQQAQPRPQEISTDSWYPPSVNSSASSSRPTTPGGTSSSFSMSRPNDRPSSLSNVSPAEAAGIIAMLKDKR